jgi:hypothetical protein
MTASDEATDRFGAVILRKSQLTKPRWLVEAQFVQAANNMCGYTVRGERRRCSSPMLLFTVRQYDFISSSQRRQGI